MHRKRIVIPAVAILLALSCAVTWWMVKKKNYPVPPDIATTPPSQILAFVGGGEFNRMTDSDREDYVMRFLDHVKDLPIFEITGILLDQRNAQNRDRAFSNVRRLKHDNKIGYTFYAIFLEKLYALPTYERKPILMALALMQGGDVSKSPFRYFVPAAGEFNGQFKGFVALHSPHIQALSINFLLEVKGLRETLGMNNEKY